MCVRALLKRNVRIECMHGPNVSVMQQQQRIIEIHNFENTNGKRGKKEVFVTKITPKISGKTFFGMRVSFDNDNSRRA